MDTTKFDAVARVFGSGMTRREALRGPMAGVAVVTAGGTLLASEETAARKIEKAPQSLCRQEQVPRPEPHLQSGRRLRQVLGDRLR